MRLVSLVSTLCLSLLLGGVALADEPAGHHVESHVAAGVDLPIPDGWSKAMDGDTLIVASPSQQISVMFIVIEEGDLESALSAMDETLNREFSDVESVDDPTEGEIGGMPALLVEGTARLQGSAVDLGIAIVATPTEKVLLVLGVAVGDALESDEAPALAAMLMGMKPSS